MSYTGFVCQIKNLRDHPNADRLYLGECFGNTVCVGRWEYAEGDVIVYFPTDGQLSEEFCAQHDLVRRKDENGNHAMYRLGHFFFVINPEFFMGLDTFRHTSGDILRALRESDKAPGQERIYTAGEKEYDIWMSRKDSGVPINESVQAEFNKVRDDLKLDYKFPWEE